MNYRMIIQYDGSRYNGWQRQKTTDMTIQGKIEEVLGKMIGQPVEINGAGRTDAGVHAMGQVANAHMDTRMSEREILGYLNHYLPEDIGVTEVKQVAERFHSRLNAGAKVYRYRIAPGPGKNVFERKYVYPCNDTLNVKNMKLAALQLVGEHDFQSFCARKMKKSSVRRLDEIAFEEKPGELWITYTGSGFLYNMVRILTGTLLEVGKGERPPFDMAGILGACDRAAAGFTAPAKGLTLMEIRYF